MIGEDVMKTIVFLMTKEENKSDDHENSFDALYE
jgi:hypothetical protein